VWVMVTLLGSGVFAGLNTKNELFILSSQVVPVVYLILVVTYGRVANRMAAKYASDEAQS
jgi:uncharacterized membrane protein